MKKKSKVIALLLSYILLFQSIFPAFTTKAYLYISTYNGNTTKYSVAVS